MGLLRKAANIPNADPVEEYVPSGGSFLEKAKAVLDNDRLDSLCDERLSRLPNSSSGSEAALAVLKTCYSCDAAFTAKREGSEYRILSSVGLTSLEPKGLTGLFQGREPGFGFSVDASILGRDDLPELSKLLVIPMDGETQNPNQVLALIGRGTDDKTLSSAYRVVRRNASRFFLTQASKKVDLPFPRTMIENDVAGLGGAALAAVVEITGLSETEATKAQALFSRLSGTSVAAAHLGGDRVLFALKASGDLDLFTLQMSKSLKRAADGKLILSRIIERKNVSNGAEAADFAAFYA